MNNLTTVFSNQDLFVTDMQAKQQEVVSAKKNSKKFQKKSD